MLTLHYLTDSRAQRVVWMLEELGVDYDLQIHPRQRNRLAPPSLRALHPLGKAPLLVDGELTLAESAHIVMHLAERHAPEMIPSEEAPAREHRYWMHFAEGSLTPPLIMKFLFDAVAGRVPAILRPLLMTVPRLIGKGYLDDTLDTLVAYVDEHLAEREFFVGEALTCADIMMIFPCEAARERFGEQRPHLRRYVERIHARPAYEAALARVGVPYMYG